jgi:hypothetical protein
VLFFHSLYIGNQQISTSAQTVSTIVPRERRSVSSMPPSRTD